MKKIFCLIITCFFVSIDSYSTHAAGMDIIYEFIGSAGTITGHQITINVTGGTYPGEVSWDIYHPSTGTIIASEYSKGIYLLELDTDNGIVNKKLILQ